MNAYATVYDIWKTAGERRPWEHSPQPLVDGSEEGRPNPEIPPEVSGKMEYHAGLTVLYVVSAKQAQISRPSFVIQDLLTTVRS